MKRERESIKGERTGAESSRAIRSESEVRDNSAGEGDEGQDKAGEKKTVTARRRRHSNWGTSRRGEPSGWSVQGRATQCQEPERKAKRGGEVEAGDHRVNGPGRGGVEAEGKAREGRVEGTSKGTEGKARET